MHSPKQWSFSYYSLNLAPFRITTLADITDTDVISLFPLKLKRSFCLRPANFLCMHIPGKGPIVSTLYLNAPDLLAQSPGLLGLPDLLPGYCDLFLLLDLGLHRDRSF